MHGCLETITAKRSKRNQQVSLDAGCGKGPNCIIRTARPARSLIGVCGEWEMLRNDITVNFTQLRFALPISLLTSLFTVTTGPAQNQHWPQVPWRTKRDQTFETTPSPNGQTASHLAHIHLLLSASCLRPLRFQPSPQHANDLGMIVNSWRM